MNVDVEALIMKKIILIILLCGIVVLCLTGCETKTNVSIEELININNKIIDYFQKNWNVKWNLNLNKGKYRLRCSTREGRKFLNIVRPIVSQINCMQYKCLEI